ncbi:MAG: hypothetical protein QM758_24075 [Armatimonas sp.]
MTTRFGLLTGIVALTLTPLAAQAQGTGPLLIRAKLGQLQVTDSDTKTAVGSGHFGAEVDFGSKLGGGNSFLSVGYFEKRQNGRYLRTIPITITNIGQGPLPFTGLYTTSGIGGYILSTNGSSRTQFGGFFGVGMRFGGMFAEAKYHQVNGGVNGLSPNGLAILIGKQF